MMNINPNISRSLENIIKKATAKSSIHRYDTVDEMLRDLKRAITNKTGDFIKFDDKNVVDTGTITVKDSDFNAIREATRNEGYIKPSELYEEDYRNKNYPNKRNDYPQYEEDTVDKKT